MGKEIVYRKLVDLKKLPNNPRTIKKDDMERLKQSIKDNPDYFEARPIILSNRTGDLVILAGNQRYEAAKALKMDEVPTFLLEGLTEAREREIIIRDNVSNGDWDMDALANEWDTQELTDWGVDINWDEPEQEIVEDEAPEVSDEPADSVLGGVYQLGRHRLMCGDSTDAGNVAILLDGMHPELLLTDPPYNFDNTPGGGTFSKSRRNVSKRIANIIDFEPEKLNWLATGQISNMMFFTNRRLLFRYMQIFEDWDMDLLVWCKTNAPPMINKKHLPDIEYLLYFYKTGKRTFNNGLQTKNYSKYFVSNITVGKKEAGGDLHPTIKPVELLAREISILSSREGIVLDLFGGSGSTLIACEQLGRKCCMMELDPKYCDVIRKRYWKFTTGSEEGWQDGTRAV